MSYRYQFHKPDGTVADLNEVDRQVCVVSNHPYSESNYCPGFVEITQFVSMSVLRGTHETRITPALFDAWRASKHGSEYLESMGYGDADVAILRKFMCEDYELELWYSR